MNINILKCSARCLYEKALKMKTFFDVKTIRLLLSNHLQNEHARFCFYGPHNDRMLLTMLGRHNMSLGQALRVIQYNNELPGPLLLHREAPMIQFYTNST
jgi:hypothetical protein